jgi:hypothetical protein
MSRFIAQVLAGSGTVARRETLALWLGDDVPLDVASEVMASVEHCDPGDDSVIDAIDQLLATRAPGSFGSLAVAVLVGSTVRALLHGAVVVQNGRGEAHSGALTRQGIRFDLPMDGLFAIIGPGGWHDPVGPPRDLRDGTVPGGGLVMREESGSPAAPVQPDESDLIATSGSRRNRLRLKQIRPLRTGPSTCWI